MGTEHFEILTIDITMLPIKRFSNDIPIEPITKWFTPSLRAYSVMARSGVKFVS